MTKETYSFTATREEADQISEKIQEWCKKAKVDKKDLIHLRLAVEEGVAVLCEKYNETKPVTLRIVSKLESYAVVLEYEGECFNPLGESEESADEWTNVVMSQLGRNKAVHNYKANINTVRFSIPKKRYKAEIYMVLAMLLAILFGLLGNYIPESVREGITTYGLDLVSDMFMHLLGLFSGLIIFFSLMNGICGMGSVSDFSRVGRSIIGRYLSLSFLSGALLTFLATFFFKFEWGGAVNQNGVLDQVKSIILSIFPSNPVQPFLEGNMLQIIFLSVFIGVVMLALGDRVRSFKTVIIQGNELITKAVGIVCKVLPIFIFTSLLSIFWTLGFDVFLSLWKPIVVTVVLSFILAAVTLLYVSIRHRVSPFKLVRGLAKGTFVSFTTASSVVAYATIKEDLTKNLGLEEQFVDFTYPIGLNLYTAGYMLIFLTTMLSLAESTKTPVSVVWFILAGFYSVAFSIATPVVSGGALICVGVMLNSLKLPDNGLALAGPLIILLDFYCTASRNFTHALDVYLQAKKFGKVDDSVLQKKAS